MTKAKRQQVEAGNLSGWMELLHVEGGAPSQLSYFDPRKNISSAINLIQGNEPQVFVLLNECFEASLRMLEEKFSLSGVDAFLASKDYRTRTGKYKNGRHGEEELRKSVKKWFSDEYAFYGAAVRQFKRQLSASQFNRSLLNEPCAYLE